MLVAYPLVMILHDKFGFMEENLKIQFDEVKSPFLGMSIWLKLLGLTTFSVCCYL